MIKMKYFPLIISLSILTVLLTPLAIATSLSAKSYPKGFIPFWSDQKGGYETTLININQIVSITPSYDDTTKRNPESVSLTIEFSSGKIIEVDEDFEEFYSRIRASQ
jgi:hypothetical protein